MAAKFVPRLVTVEQGELEACFDVKETFFFKVITSERKQQLRPWKTSKSFRLKEFRHVNSNIKINTESANQVVHLEKIWNLFVADNNSNR